ncbi:hypothetical protein T492DRAFT_841285 [Pavlovales sp. CCMP2436]|nr:hypothetical protein T492DRAFT_841285 [Pavlovales sp. CCMP2436]
MAPEPAPEPATDLIYRSATFAPPPRAVAPRSSGRASAAGSPASRTPAAAGSPQSAGSSSSVRVIAVRRMSSPLQETSDAAKAPAPQPAVPAWPALEALRAAVLLRGAGATGSPKREGHSPRSGGRLPGRGTLFSFGADELAALSREPAADVGEAACSSDEHFLGGHGSIINNNYRAMHLPPPRRVINMNNNNKTEPCGSL